MQTRMTMASGADLTSIFGFGFGFPCSVFKNLRFNGRHPVDFAKPTPGELGAKLFVSGVFRAYGLLGLHNLQASNSPIFGDIPKPLGYEFCFPFCASFSLHELMVALAFSGYDSGGCGGLSRIDRYSAFDSLLLPTLNDFSISQSIRTKKRNHSSATMKLHQNIITEICYQYMPLRYTTPVYF